MPASPDQYAVIGNPVAHSKSPLIHQMFAAQTLQDLEYKAIEAPADDFADTLKTLCAQGLQGFNITIPFKTAAWQLATERSDYAQRAGAVNTLLVRADGSLYGANTDGLGLVRDLISNQQVQLEQKHILVLGAGGAVRGILEPLLAEQPATVFIANRTAARAEALAADFAGKCMLSGGGYADIRGSFDVIINGTAASLAGDLPPLPANCLSAGGCCYDMMYGKEPTPFLAWGAQQDAGKLLDGLGMLVEQAAESFLIWRGVRPETLPVLTALHQQLQAD